VNVVEPRLVSPCSVYCIVRHRARLCPHRTLGIQSTRRAFCPMDAAGRDGTLLTRASMGPNQQSWAFLGTPAPLQKARLSCARGLLAVLKPLSRNSKNAMVGMRLSFHLPRRCERFFDLPRFGAGRGRAHE
jgi:hypothetical protein